MLYQGGQQQQHQTNHRYLILNTLYYIDDTNYTLLIAQIEIRCGKYQKCMSKRSPTTIK
jgi:hypothetical protein